MTLKEQIMKLQTYKMHEGEDTVYVERDDVLKALEQEPCYNPDEWCRTCSEYDHEKHCCPRYNKVIRNTVEEIKQPCEDAISRAEAVRVASGYCHPSNIAEELAKLPAVQSIRPKGHWKESNRDACPECSICGELQDYKSDFCPNCGAEMMNVPDKNDGKLSEIPIGSESEE